MTTEELLRLKDKISKGKARVEQLKGQKQQLMKTLKEDYDCKTIEEADKKIETSQTKISKLEQQIKADVEQLKEDYPVLFERV